MIEQLVAALLAALAALVPASSGDDRHPEPPSRSTERPAPSAPASSPSTVEGEPSPKAWARLRWCEARGDYAIDTGNGYFGAYQFDLTTWASVGGSGNPALAAPAEQDRRALALWRDRGSQPWPVCGRYLEE